MNTLKDRKLAILITIMIVIVATALGVYKTSYSYTKKIESGFYNDAMSGGRATCINSYLDNCASYAKGLATMMAKYPALADKSEALMLAQRELLDAATITLKESANARMVECFKALSSAAAGSVLTDERDAEALAGYSSDFYNAQRLIGQSGYNDTVTAYLDGRSPFMKIFDASIKMKTPAYFTCPTD